jgi:hypothetical protein
MSRVEEILKELVSHCIYRKNVSPNNFEVYREDSIRGAKAAILAHLLEIAPEKIKYLSGAEKYNEAIDHYQSRIREELK